MLGLLSSKRIFVMVQNEIPIPTIEYIVRRCHEANVKSPLKSRLQQLTSIPEWLELATYITPNEHGLSALYLINLLRKHC